MDVFHLTWNKGLHAVMRYTKGAPLLLNPISHDLMQKIKGAKVSVADSRPFATPSRFLSRQNYRAFLRNVCDSLRL